MRAVAQRVLRLAVHVEGVEVARMGAGVLALVGVERGDGARDALWLAEKLVQLRIFPDAEGRMNRSLLDAGAGLAVVSQFTLLGDCRKGRRPSYSAAEQPEAAAGWIEAVAARARALGASVVTGVFRAHMQLDLLNDGPVTLLLDSRQLF